MGRPKIKRIIRTLPGLHYFMPHVSPIQNPNVPVENLTIEEFEALRLKHYLKLSQIECAKKMQISQSTFSRILESAHSKITRALVEGKGLVMGGGSYGIKKTFLGYGCADCLHEWKLSISEDIHNDDIGHDELEKLLPLTPEIKCPKCGSHNIYRLKKDIVVYPS
ncbi:MAG: DUF134 domain-containing protein [Promethearchaeota archaeon]